MEPHTTHFEFKYRIQQKPDGGWIASSDDGSTEPVEADSKTELFVRLREKAGAVIGTQLPSFDGGAPKAAVTSKVVINFNSKSKEPSATDGSNLAVGDVRPLAEQSPGSNIWKLLFFVLLGLIIAWFVTHRR